MAFRNLMDSVKNFFGPNNSFFNGPRAEEETAYNPAPAASDSGYYAQPQQQGQMPYGQAAYQQPVNPFAPPQPVYAQPQQPAFSEQQPSQGYVPDHEGAEYNSAVM